MSHSIRPLLSGSGRSVLIRPRSFPSTSLSSSFRPSSSSSTIRPISTGPKVQTTHVTANSAEEMRRAREMMHERQRQMYERRGEKSKNAMYYGAGCLILALGATYAAVPLYRAFCGATGFGGIPITDNSKYTPDRLYPDEDAHLRNRITVHFEATASDDLKWKFTPQQRFVKVLPGETALAFYTAENWGTEDVVGIATYNITPSRVSPYFAKVECFCFEQQKIRAGEQVDLPVFFFIDKDILDDPSAEQVDDMVLSYTFFKARRNEQGHLEPDASSDEVEKSLGFQDYELAKKSDLH